VGITRAGKQAAARPKTMAKASRLATERRKTPLFCFIVFLSGNGLKNDEFG
jgi:hypothetical protein